MAGDSLGFMIKDSGKTSIRRIRGEGRPLENTG